MFGTLVNAEYLESTWFYVADVETQLARQSTFYPLLSLKPLIKKIKTKKMKKSLIFVIWLDPQVSTKPLDTD